MNNCFKKNEHLCGLAPFEILLKEGNSKLCFPIKLVWVVKENPDNVPVKVGFSVPKKRFKRANKRNTLKRRMRESFRLNNHDFYQFLIQQNLQIYLLLVYISNDELEYNVIEKSLKNVFKHIMAEISKGIK